MEILRNLVFQYANAIVFLPLYLAATYKSNLVRQQKTLLVYLVLSAFTQVISFTFWKLRINNLPILHIYTVLEYLVLIQFYRFLLKGVFTSVFFLILSALFPVFSIVNSLFFESIFTFNTMARSLEALILIFMAVNWFVKIVAEDENERERYRGINYINMGLLVYFSGSIVLFAFSNQISVLSQNFYMNIWTLHTLLTVQLYMLITIGLWKARAR